MKTPKPGQVYEKNAYWKNVENNRLDNGRLYPWVFDFISIHPSFWDKNTYGFCAPMCLVDKNERSKRMDFEDDQYFGKRNAFAAAKKIAKMYGVFVVYCPEPTHSNGGSNK